MNYPDNVYCKKKLSIQNGVISFEPGVTYRAKLNEKWIIKWKSKESMPGVLVHQLGITNTYNEENVRAWFFPTEKKFVDSTFPYFHEYFDIPPILEEGLFEI